MPKYRKKPVVIEAVQWNGDNAVEIAQFMGVISLESNADSLFIDTLEGTMRASVGDWIIKGVSGEHYPCKPDIFDATYEAVEEAV